MNKIVYSDDIFLPTSVFSSYKMNHFIKIQSKKYMCYF